MNSSPRYLPPGRFLAEITQRCLQGRFLLRPSKRLNELVAGVVAVAQRKYPIEVIGLAVASNHYHLIVTGTSQEDLSEFMNFVASNVAREAGKLRDWKGKFWEGRYKCIPITEEEESQVARLKYLLSHGCKEGLVASPRHWPGVHCAKALMTGGAIRGVWVDRTALYHAKRGKKPQKIRPIDFEEEVLLEFSPLPCWEHLEPEAYQQRVRDLVEDIENETLAQHRAQGTKPLGRKKVLQRNPYHRPKRIKRKPRPRVHAATREARTAFLEAYRAFVKAYRGASVRLRRGDPMARFPKGSFPPRGPFQRFAASSRTA